MAFQEMDNQMSVTHLAFSLELPGAGQSARRIADCLLELGVDTRMESLDRGTTGLSVVSRELDLLPKRFLWKFRRNVATGLNPDTSLGWWGKPFTSRSVMSDSDLIQLHWICGGFMRPEQLVALASYPLVWRLADMWPFCGTEHYTAGNDRYVEGYLSHNRPEIEEGPDVNRWVWNRKRKAYSKLPDLTIVAPSRWMADCAKRSALFKDRRIEYIATGTDLDVFRPLDRKATREQLGLPGDSRIVLFGSITGTASPRKGFKHLLHALEILGKSREVTDDIHLVTFGSHPTEQRFELPFPVTALGPINSQEDLATAYSAADLFVAPSREENLANTVLEALACGTPVVAFDIGGMPDAIDHMRNGYLAQPFDDEDLAAGIAAIIDLSKARYSNMRARARKKTESHFEQVAQAKRYLELYEDILSRRHHQRAQ